MPNHRKFFATVVGALLAFVALGGCATSSPAQSSSDIMNNLARDSQGR